MRAMRCRRNPWRTRIAFVETLDEATARDWLFALRDTIEGTLAGLDDSRTPGVGIGAELENAQARLVTAARLAWVDQAIASLARAALKPPTGD